MGKTALLDYASRVAADLRVVRLIGVESETDLALLSLLSDAATSGTIMVCIDDAQWLDSESIDNHRVRGTPHARADALVILLAFRVGAADVKALAGLPVLDVVGLADAPAGPWTWARKLRWPPSGPAWSRSAARWAFAIRLPGRRCTAGRAT